MEDAFPYVETPDQRVAIVDVKADMERAYPMDRLVCGDVGFGKTEVAIRAAFKAIQDGKQVAVLAPTTLLATQHGNTFADRFAGYPIRVETLSRFLTPAQARDVVKGIESGDVDCVIGTHRLLGEQVRFKDLGLLVVDEEQRFGVTHKEAMKQLKTNVDVLTLTATPIPRTLEMSLVGIRDLSLLQTPPSDRQPILTYVGGYDERVAVEAIRRELLREGQVFWVHNRVRSIEHAAARLRELVPEARIAVAHGQMDEGTLEQVVVDFWDGQFDVLVCTTIIESGIDMPTVNTLVVERADLLGLGQMHQLRGRVGRSGQRAYAYLFHPVDTVLTEEAYERLKTIGESTELGSGFKIAMRDLEIRGAGNLLGEAQSGHIAAVGYDLYCQMVTEAVAEMKGEPVRPPAEIKLDVPTDAFLPKDFVAKEELRLEAYRRLAAVTTTAQVDDIRTEWEDRYGPLPPAAEALLTVGYLRAECHRLGITDIVMSSDQARLAPLELKLSQTTRLRRLSRDAIYKEDARQLVLPIPRQREPAGFLVELLRELVPADAAACEPSGLGERAMHVASAGSFGAVTNRLAAAGAAVLAVLAVSGCGAVPAAGTAATVGDQDISVDDFERLLGVVTEHEDLFGIAADPTTEHRPGGRGPQRPARCSCRARSRDQFLAANGESITDADRQAVIDSFGEEDPLADLPDDVAQTCSSTRRPAHRPRPASRRRPPRSCRRSTRSPARTRDRLRAPRAGRDGGGGAGRARRAGGRRVDRGPRPGRSTDESAATNGGALQAAQDVDCAPIAGRRGALRSPSSPRPPWRRSPGSPTGPVQSSLGWHVIEAQALRRTSPRTSSRSTSRSARSCDWRRSRLDLDVRRRPAIRALGPVDGFRRRPRRDAAAAVTVVGLGPGGHDHVTVETAPRDRAHPAPVPAHGQAPERRSRPGRRVVRSPLRVGRPLRGRLRGDRRGRSWRPPPSTARCSTRSPARRSCSSARCARCSPTTASSATCCRRCRSSTWRGPASASTRSRRACDSSTATSSPPPRRARRAPLLITHTHANWVLSDIKLAVEDATGDEPVVILRAPRDAGRVDHRRRRGASSTAPSRPTT